MTATKTEHDHQERAARFALWQDIQSGKAHVLPVGQLEKELEMEFGTFTRDPEADDREMEDGFAGDGEPSLVPVVTLGELRRRSEERTRWTACTTGCGRYVEYPGICDECSMLEGPDAKERKSIDTFRFCDRTAFSVLSAFFSLPLARKERPLPRLVTRARAADLFERFFGPRRYLGGRIYS